MNQTRNNIQFTKTKYKPPTKDKQMETLGTRYNQIFAKIIYPQNG